MLNEARQVGALWTGEDRAELALATRRAADLISSLHRKYLIIELAVW